MTDRDGSIGTSTISVEIIDDVPTAIDDEDSIVEGAINPAEGNVLTDAELDGGKDTQGADDATVTGVSFDGNDGTIGVPLAGEYGELKLNADGTYSYQLDNADPEVAGLAQGETLVEIFTYVITDGDGDQSTATLKITITGVNDRPQIGIENLRVSEEGLPAALVDNGGNTDTTNSKTASGTVTVNDPDLSDTQSFALSTTGTTAGLTSHGVPILWTIEAGTGDLLGMAGTAEIVRVHIDTTTGAYTVALNGTIDHPVNGLYPNSEDNLDFAVPVTVVSGPDTINTSFTVTVEDDSPMITAVGGGGSSTTELLVGYEIRAGNVADRGLFGPEQPGTDFDILLTGLNGDGGDDSVNTSSFSIGVGAGQDIGNGETVIFDFVTDLSITGTPGSPIITTSGVYDVLSASFTLPKVQGPAANEAVVFVSAIDGGAPITISSITVNGTPVTGVPVYVGGVLTGYVLENVYETDTIKVTGATPFDRLVVSNYNGVSADTDGNGSLDTTFSGGHDFKLGGLTSVVEVTTTTGLIAIHDETAGVNPGADPNAANDVASALAPAELATFVGGLANAGDLIGYAMSTGSVTSLFNGQYGADGPGTISFALTKADGTAFVNVDSGLDALDGTSILLNTVGNVVTGTAGGTTVFVLYIDSENGNLWVAQLEPISHTNDGSTAATYDDQLNITANVLNVKATIVDDDGDTASAMSTVPVTVGFQDDGPKASADGVATTEGAAQIVTTAATGVLGNDDAGADHPGTVTGVSGGTIGTPIVTAAGTLTLYADGHYTYTPKASVPSGTVDSFTYTLTDADGDTDTAVLSFTFSGDNNVPTATNGVAVTSDVPGDDSVAGSNADAFVPQVVNGSLAFNFGLDTPGSFVSAVYDGNLGAATTSSLLGTTTIAATDGSWTLEINETTGAYTFTQLTAYDHDLGAATDGAVVTVNIKDSDNSPASATITLTINDDIPDANDDGVATTEGAAQIVTTAATGVLGNDDAGADHPGTVTGVSGGTIGTPIVTAAGTLTLYADGHYTYTPKASVPSGTVDSFTYTLTDADGDTDTAVLSFTFSGDNNVPTATNGVAVTSDVPGDDSVAGSNADAFVPQVVNGSLAFNFGLDTPGSFVSAVYDGNLGAATTSSLLGTTTIAATDGSWTLEINETTGAYTFTQLTAYDHDLGAATDGAVVTVNIKDSDNSPASATITLTINDDIPDANDDGVATTEGAAQIVTTAATGVLGNDDAGADHPGTVTGVSGGTIGTPIVTAAGTLTLYADGHYTYTPKASVPSGTVDSFTYTLTDADGDTDTAVLSFTFSGDNNVPTATNGVAVTSDVPGDDSVAGSNADAFVPQVVNGSLAFNFGLQRRAALCRRSMTATWARPRRARCLARRRLRPLTGPGRLRSTRRRAPIRSRS